VSRTNFAHAVAPAPLAELPWTHQSPRPYNPGRLARNKRFTTRGAKFAQRVGKARFPREIRIRPRTMRFFGKTDKTGA
jgi:hypothetical protein